MLIFGIALSMQAQYSNKKDSYNSGGGLFSRSLVSDETYYGAYRDYNLLLFNRGLPNIPGGHGDEDDQPAPIGSGAVLLLGFGAAYAMAKKRKENQ